MSQIGLPLDWTGRGDDARFLVSGANAIAARHMESWRDWPIPVTILTGPARSGRSTLGREFAALSGGQVIDDAQGIAERAPTDNDLFHAWNIARDTGRPLLLIGRDDPALWPVALPDLRSRLAAAPHVRIGEPDDALVIALIEQGLNQAGSAHSADVAPWIARHIERSYAAVDRALATLNDASVSSSRKISVRLAKETLRGAGILPILSPEDGAVD